MNPRYDNITPKNFETDKNENIVYVVVSILNGYKNIEGLFACENDARKFKAEKESDWHYENHAFCVCPYMLW